MAERLAEFTCETLIEKLLYTPILEFSVFVNVWDITFIVLCCQFVTNYSDGIITIIPYFYRQK
jgi:hypothetical protein